GRAEFRSKQAAFDFTISGEMILPCSRTLVDVRYPFSISTKELFIFHKTEELEDEDVHIVEDDLIDLTPVVKEEILLEIPMQIFCESVQKEEGAPQEGKDWQVITEDDRKNRIDPRLAGLEKLLKQDDES
ncbi:YceD family protein, partial [Bacillus paralicheniformis]